MNAGAFFLLLVSCYGLKVHITCSLPNFKLIFERDSQIQVNPKCNTHITSASIIPQLPEGLILYKNGTVSGRSIISPYRQEYTLKLQGDNNFEVKLSFTLTIKTPILLNDKVVENVKNMEGKVVRSVATVTYPSIVGEFGIEISASTPSSSEGMRFAVNPDTPLPLGLELNEKTGAISGVPAASFDGTININVISSEETTSVPVSIKITGCINPFNAIYLKYKADMPDSKVMIEKSNGQVLYSKSSHLNEEYVYAECYIPSKTHLTLSFDLPHQTEGYFTLIVNEMMNQHLIFTGKKTIIKRMFYTINEQPPKPFYSSQTITTYVGDNIYTTPFVNYGVTSFEAVNLPSTFNFNRQTGEISGVLEESISFQVVVTNPYGSSTVDLSFNVSESIPTPTPTTPLPTGCNGNEYKIKVTINAENESRKMKIAIYNIYGNLLYNYKGNEDFTIKELNLCLTNEKITFHLSSSDGNPWDSTSLVVVEYGHVANTKTYRYTGESNPEIEQYSFYTGMYGEWQYSTLKQHDNSWNIGFKENDWEVFTGTNYPEQTEITTYYRRIFILYENIAEFNNIFAKIFYTSGVIMYINGEVALKKNLPETVTGDTFGTEYKTDGYELSLVLAIHLLHTGENYIAVELHKAEIFDVLTPKFEVLFQLEKGYGCKRCVEYSPLTCSAKNNQNQNPDCSNLVDNDDLSYNSFIHNYKQLFGNKEYKPITFTGDFDDSFECFANKYYYVTGNENGKNTNKWEFYLKNDDGEYELSDSFEGAQYSQSYTLIEFPLSTPITSHTNSFQWKILMGQHDAGSFQNSYIITSEIGLETCNPLGKGYNYCNDIYNGPSTEGTELSLPCKNGYIGTYQRKCGSDHEWIDSTESCYLPDYDSSIVYGVGNVLKPVPNIKTDYQLLSGSGALSYVIIGKHPNWLSFDTKTGVISVTPENNDYSFAIEVEATRVNEIFKSKVTFEMKSLVCNDDQGNSIPVNTVFSYPCGDGFENNESGKKRKCVAIDESNSKLLDADISECKYLRPSLNYENNGVFVIDVDVAVSIKPSSSENIIEFIHCNNCNEIPSGLSFDITSGSISGKTSVAGRFVLNIEYGNRDFTIPATITINVRKIPTYLTYGVSDTVTFYKGFETSEYPKTDGVFDSYQFITNDNNDGKFVFDENTGVIKGKIVNSHEDDMKIIVAANYQGEITYVTVVVKVVQPTCPADSRYNDGNPGIPGNTYERPCEAPYSGSYSVYCPVEMNPRLEDEISHCHYYPTTFRYSSSSFIVFAGDSTSIIPELDQGGESGTVVELTQGILPSGLSLNAKTGVISGTTNEVGMFNVFVTATYERSIKVGLTLVVVVPSCFADTVNNYEETKRNEIVSKECGLGFTGNETRKCLDTNPPEWGEIDRSQCVLLPIHLKYSEDHYYLYVNEEFTLEPTVKENLFTSMTCTEIPGFVFDPHTGILRGTPTTEGEYNITIYGRNSENEITIPITLIVTHTRPTEVKYNEVCQFYYKFTDECTASLNQGYADSYSIEPELTIEGLTFDSTNGKISGIPKVKSFEGDYQVKAIYTGNYTLSNTFKIIVSHSYCPNNENYSDTDAGDSTHRDCLDNLWGNITITCSYDRLNPQFENEVFYCRPRYPYQFSYGTDVYELKGSELIDPIFPVFEGQESTRFYVSKDKLPTGLTLNERTGRISGIPAEDVLTVRVVEIEARDERSMFANISFVINMPKCPADPVNGYEETIAGKIVYKECGEGYSGIESRECSSGSNPEWGMINRGFCTYLLPNVAYDSSSFTLYQNEYVNITAIRDESKIDKYNAFNLPIGLSINSESFDITGIPSIPGHFQTIITFSNERDESQTILSFTVLKERPKKMEYKDSLVFSTEKYSIFNITLEGGGSVDYFSIVPELTISGIYLSAVNGSIYGMAQKGNKGTYKFTVYGSIATERISTEITITINEAVCPALTVGVPETPRNTSYHLQCSEGLYGYIEYKCSDSNDPSWSSPINYCHELSPSKFEYSETAMLVYIGRETNLKPTFVGREDFTIFTIIKGELPEGLRIEKGAVVGVVESAEYYGKYMTIIIQAEDDVIKVATLKLSITQVQCDKALFYGFDWPNANESTEIVFDCPYGYSGTTKGKCIASAKDDTIAEWSNIEMNCESEIPGIVYPSLTVEFIVYYDDFYTPQLLGPVKEVKIIEGILPLGVELDPSTGELAASAYVPSDAKTVKIVAVNGEYTSQEFSLTISAKMLYCPSDNGYESVPIGFQSTKQCGGDLEGVLIRDCPIEKENPKFGEEYGECKQPKPTLIYLDSYYQVIIDYVNVSIKPYKMSGNPTSITISPEELPDGLKFDSKTALIYGIPKAKKYQEYTITVKNDEGEENVKITLESTVVSCPKDGLWPQTSINSYGYIECSGKNQKFHIQRKCDEIVPTPQPIPFGEWNHISASYCTSKSKVLGSSVDKTLIILPFTFIEAVDLSNSKSYLGLVKGIQDVITTTDTIILLDSVKPTVSKSRRLEGSNYIYAYIYTLKPTSVQLTVSNKKNEIIESIKNNEYTDEYKSQVFAIEDIEVINPNPNEQQRNEIVDTPSVANSALNRVKRNESNVVSVSILVVVMMILVLM